MPPTYQARIVVLAALSCCLLGESRFSCGAEVAVRLVSPHPGQAANKAVKEPPAVVWLEPVPANPGIEMSPGKFVLTQRNKMFVPHLLVVPVGSSVAFPNQDPFFHNVFSLFDGKRFDLGLYEAGSSRSVVFSRKGVSYIFCDIHSEMSAVVISLTTPFYSVSDKEGVFRLEVPDGDYDLHVWIEGQRQAFLEGQTRRVHVAGRFVDLGEIRSEPPAQTRHLDKFGRPYEPESTPVY